MDRSVSDRGYGVFRISHSWVGAHVYSYEMHYGPVVSVDCGPS